MGTKLTDEERSKDLALFSKKSGSVEEALSLSEKEWSFYAEEFSRRSKEQQKLRLARRRHTHSQTN